MRYSHTRLEEREKLKEATKERKESYHILWGTMLCALMCMKYEINNSVKGTLKGQNGLSSNDQKVIFK